MAATSAAHLSGIWSVFMYLLMVFHQLPKRKCFTPNTVTGLRSQLLFNSAVVSGNLSQTAACRETDPECCSLHLESDLLKYSRKGTTALCCSMCLEIKENPVRCGDLLLIPFLL